VGSPASLAGVELVAAVDVRAPFLQAPAAFGPQKGASPEQVELLEDRLQMLATRYRHRFGVDVTNLVGAGAAGGLAGGLAALGARIRLGFDLVAGMIGLGGEIANAELVVTGEGRLDRTSFEGKVVGGVIDLVNGQVPVLCVVGSADEGGLALVPAWVEVVELAAIDRLRGLRQTTSMVEQVVAERLRSR
jgi:glycerate kinase